MSRLDCERWASLLDRETLEGVLSTDEAAFQERHARSCQNCAHELSKWRELRSLGQGSALERDVALEESVLAELWQRPVVAPRRGASRLTKLAGLAAVVAVAAASLLFVLSRRDPSLEPALPPPALAHATVGSGSGLVAGSNTTRLPGEPIRAGSRLQAGDEPLCLLIEPAVRACLSPRGELKVADLTLSQRRLELIRGRLVTSLDRQPAGSTFSVSSGITTVTAVGTIFTVEVPGDHGNVVVRVLEGKVEVRSHVEPARVLHARESLVFGSQALGSVSSQEEVGDLALLRVEPQPSSAAASAGSPVPPVPSAEIPAKSEGPKVSAPAAEPLDPSALLREAVEQRAQGRFADAARAYRQLVTQYPSSSEARAALVSLGDLQLSRLGQPEAALRSFDAYLKNGDRGLRQEAEYGRIRALRALGRSQDEAKAIERLLERYPAGVHAESMRARLASLRDAAH
jgi:TolA-binding protein